MDHVSKCLSKLTSTLQTQIWWQQLVGTFQMSSTHAVTTIPFVDGIGVVKSLARWEKGRNSSLHCANMSLSLTYFPGQIIWNACIDSSCSTERTACLCPFSPIYARNNWSFLAQVCTLEACFTDIHWYPSMSQRQRTGAGSDVFVVACTDGNSPFQAALYIYGFSCCLQGTRLGLVFSWACMSYLSVDRFVLESLLTV